MSMVKVTVDGAAAAREEETSRLRARLPHRGWFRMTRDSIEEPRNSATLAGATAVQLAEAASAGPPPEAVRLVALTYNMVQLSV
jgi:hypothetical protein